MNSISTGSICRKILKTCRKGESRFVVGYLISFILDANCCYFPGSLGRYAVQSSARRSLNFYNKNFFNADVQQICGKKSRLAAVLSRNKFETYVLKLHIFNLNNETRRMRHSSAPRALLRTYPIFSLYARHNFFFVIRKGSSYILKTLTGLVISEKAYITPFQRICNARIGKQM